VKPVISLLTDYGLKDPYVAQIKAVILSYARDAAIIDLTHEISAFNELQAAFILKISTSHMPKETIHVCVVDPGVGSERRGIIVQTRRGDVFIGPDTGFMIPAAEELGISSVYVIDESKLPPKKCETFHGRDVFAHVAGMLATGRSLNEIGIKTIKYARLKLPEPRFTENLIEARAMHVDRFGNVITNIPSEKFFAKHGDQMLVAVGDEKIKCRYVKSYAHASVGEPLLTDGGTGYVELSINRGSAASRFRISPGDELLFQKI